jgi:hypothetical protein
VVIDWRASTKGSDLRPAMSVIGEDGAYMRISNGGEARYLLPVGAILSVGDGDEVKAGEVMARIPINFLLPICVREKRRRKAILSTRQVSGSSRLAEVVNARRQNHP